MKLRILAAIAISAVTLAAYSSTAHATTVSADATVTINYTGACTVSTANATIAYRAAPVVSTAADVTVSCNSGVPWSLAAGPGLNVSGETRRGILGAEFLNYHLYKDSGLAQEITVSSNIVATGNGTGINQITTAYYAVKSADNSPAPSLGTYADTLGYTLTY
jgi:spore coat protein U-like protein